MRIVTTPFFKTWNARLCIVPLAFFLLTLLSGCSEDRVKPVFEGSITGQVLDFDSQLPLANATVTTDPATTSVICDENGNFTLTDVPTGDYRVTGSKSLYSENSVNIAVERDKITSVVIQLSLSPDDNVAPVISSAVTPSNGAEEQAVNVDLNWQIIDKDENDSVRVDLFLYKSNQAAPTKVLSDFYDTTYTLKNLDFNTAYYWQLVARDTKDHEVKSDVFSFKTESFPDNHFHFTREFNDEDYEIFTSDTSGARLVQLTDNTFKDWNPVLNPQRTKIAFVSDREGKNYVYTMERDGTNQQRLTTIPVAGYHNQGIGISWSDDGGKLLFSSYSSLMQVDNDGANQEVLATAPGTRHFREIAYSPTGNKIVAIAIGLAEWDSQLLIMDPDGTNIQVLVDDLPGIMESPSFSIDGQYVMFTRDVAGFESPTGRQLDSRIFTIKIDGTGLTDISSESKPDGTNDLQPRFSPNGAQIVFVNVSNDDFNERTVYIMNVDGDERKAIFSNAEMPYWL